MSDRAHTPLLDRPLHASWMRPSLVELERLPMRPPLVSYPDVAGARGSEREASPWLRSLDGRWRFRLYDRPQAVPAEVATPEHDDAGWDTIAVPGCWTRQGYDHPHYTNVQMPWRCEPPQVPEHNPTGVYRTTFEIDAAWAARRSVLSLGGAESVAYVWCNGSFIGMGKDSRLASEFDLTAAVLPGRNLLTVVVVRWSDATWLEDQDHWYHAGLHREVLLYSTDQAWIADLSPRAGLDAEGHGTLHILAGIGSTAPLEVGWRVEVAVENMRGKPLARRPWIGEVATLDRSSVAAEVVNSYGYPGPFATIDAEGLAVLPWSHEAPTRYRLIASLVDPDGRVREVVAQWIGFRNVEMAGCELLLNGEAVLIRGVNRHDHHAVHGKTLSAEDIRSDLVSIKRFGMNAVRTAHYPNDPCLLDLCDEIGLWVIDEANVETHARWGSLLHDEAFAPAVLARIKRMVVRDRSHPCVMGWSLGNESGYAPVHDEAAAWIRRVDPTRFVHYEGALHTGLAPGSVGDGGHAASDVVCPMYPSLDALRDWARTTRGDRPLIMCEYSHAMGNSNGSLHDYWALIEATPGLQGGFIWDFKDQGLLEKRADGRPWYAFGGHFGDQPNDANFCCNGLVGPEGVPHPGAFEHAKLAEIVRAVPVALRRGLIRIENRQWFSDLSELRATWSVEIDGRRVQHGRLDLPDLAAGQSARVELPIESRVLDPGQTAMLGVHFVTRRGSVWAPRGFGVAWSQLELPWRKRKLASATRRHRTAADVDVDPATGSLQIAECLVSAPRPCLWRAPTDNDGVKQGWMSAFAGVRRRWLEWGLDRLDERLLEVTRRGRKWIVIRELVGADGERALHRQTITLLPGAANLLEQIEIPRAWNDLPRVGVRLAVDGRFDTLEWLGLGPHASYPDRKEGVRFGRFGGRVSDQYEPYSVPQEHGGHVDTRWLTLLDAGGHGVRILADPSFSFTASHHSLESLTAALNESELDAGDDIHVHLDAAVRGVGTGACGPDTLPAYRVSAGRRRWR
ncbi:MAG: DUF4981 domain-containing protein, partial [Deltaproteobacteria bacterium]|nr:DUF4981 domain-containing protein [Deltaproteobacteria bacterium]